MSSLLLLQVSLSLSHNVCTRHTHNLTISHSHTLAGRLAGGVQRRQEHGVGSDRLQRTTVLLIGDGVVWQGRLGRLVGRRHVSSALGGRVINRDRVAKTQMQDVKPGHVSILLPT